MRSQSTKFDITIESRVSLPRYLHQVTTQSYRCLQAGECCLFAATGGTVVLWSCGPVVLWYSSPALLTILATFSRYAAPCPAYTLYLNYLHTSLYRLPHTHYIPEQDNRGRRHSYSSHACICHKDICKQIKDLTIK